MMVRQNRALSCYYLGIDPGASGGIASLLQAPAWVDRCAVSSGRPQAGLAVKMPDTPADIWQTLRSFVAQPGVNCTVFAVLEKVGGYVGENQPGSAAFKFGTSYGMLKMALVAAGIPFEEITPQRWQKGLGIPPRRKSESKTAWKNRLKDHAQRLFPAVKITLAVADALLIAEFARRYSLGFLNDRG